MVLTFGLERNFDAGTVAVVTTAQSVDVPHVEGVVSLQVVATAVPPLRNTSAELSAAMEMVPG
ncbi:MAG TPA: hypothetical protein VFR24_17000 [Candidatus Angelobacter sp.]|nr:hypothetical protein [Candidatus Angelobacter sp.]